MGDNLYETEEDYLGKRQKLYEEIESPSNMKLTLRKNKLTKKIIEKITSNWTYQNNSSGIYTLEFLENEFSSCKLVNHLTNINDAKNLIKSQLSSDIAKEVAAGLYNLNEIFFLKEKVFLTDFVSAFDIDFISYLCDKIVGYIEDKFTRLIFNSLYFLVNYTMKINVTTSICALFEQKFNENFILKCLEINNIEVLIQLFLLIKNIITDKPFYIYFLLDNEKIINYIFSLYDKYQVGERIKVAQNDLISNFVSYYISFLCSLLYNKPSETREQEGNIFNVKKEILKLLLKDIISANYFIYYEIIYSLDILMRNGNKYAEIIKNSNLINKILIDRSFFEQENIKGFSNNILNSLLCSDIKMDDDFYLKLIEYEGSCLNTLSSDIYIETSFLILTNIIVEYNEKLEQIRDIISKIFKINNLYELIHSFISKTSSNDLLKEIFIFLGEAIPNMSNEDFSSLYNKKIFEIIMKNHNKYANDQKLSYYYLSILLIFLQYCEFEKEKTNNINIGVKDMKNNISNEKIEIIALNNNNKDIVDVAEQILNYLKNDS